MIKNLGDDVNGFSVKRKTDFDNIRSRRTITECQLLHHIGTQTIECIDKLQTIDLKKEAVTTERQNILDLIPGADCETMKVLQEYSQLGLLFTFNIADKPTFSYRQRIVSSLVMLKSVADTIFMTFMKGILVCDKLLEVQTMIDALCKMGPIGDESLGWMSRCASRAIITAINSIDDIRDISLLIPSKQTKLETSYSQFTQFARLQAASVLKWLEPKAHEINNLKISQREGILLQLTYDVVSCLGEAISQTIHETIAPGQKLHQQVCSLYGNMASQSNLDQFVGCISDLAKLSTYSFQLSDEELLKDAFEKLAFEMWLHSRQVLSSHTTDRIKEIATKIDTANAIETFSFRLCNKMTQFQKTMPEGYLNDDEKMLEAITNVLTSVWSDNIHFMVQSWISQSLMFDLQRKTTRVYPLTNNKLECNHRTMVKHQHFIKRVATGYTKSAQIQTSQELSTRLKHFYRDQNRSRDPQVWTMIEASLASKRYKLNINILNVNKISFINISFPENRETCELIYSPPSRAFPDGHYDALKDGKLVQVTKPVDEDDCNMFHAALRVHTNNWEATIDEHIDLHPRQCGELFASVHYAYQLKRVRALLRPDSIIHSTIRINQSKHTEPDALPRFSCIEQALRSGNVSQLAKVLAKYESGSRSAEGNSSTQKTDMMTLSVSNDACNIFLLSGNSVEAKVYRQLVVERINDGYITTALKLCYIGHQIAFFQGGMNDILPCSYYDKSLQTIRDTFEQMLKMESYEQEKSKFLLTSVEWFKILEPQGLMNFEQRELLMEWIADKQYANTEDSVVSMVIERTSKKIEERKREERKRQKEEKDIQQREEKQEGS